MNLALRQPHVIGMDIRDLADRGFATLRYPPLIRNRMAEVMQSWKGFCSLPIEEKRKLTGGDRIHDFGYMKREDKGPVADDKELFHVVRKRLPQLRAKADTVLDRRATHFIYAVGALIDTVSPLIRIFAQEVERAYGLRGFESEVMSSQDNWTFRYLHYFPGARAALANAHADRGGFTFHTWEDHEGGEFYGLDKSWQPWPVSEEQTIIFPSLGLQYRSGSRLKALWHRVVPNKTTAAVGRYSMVVFIDFEVDCIWDKVTYPKVQDFAPGFNYGLLQSEFEQYFIPARGTSQVD